MVHLDVHISVFGVRPFQVILNLAYAIWQKCVQYLVCESCGTPSPWVRPIRWIVNGQLHYLVPVITRVQIRTSPSCRRREVHPRAHQV